MWFFYVVRCSDSSLYAGITTNLKRRVHEHNNTKKGAKYTGSRRPVYLVAHERFYSKQEAMLNENAFKKKTKKQKENYCCDYDKYRKGPG
jgi:putative endonuclease